MDLADEYRRQFAWRDWPRALAALPDVAGHTVLDLGCGVGDLAAALAARGARVVGVDASAELLHAASARGIAGAEFVRADLRALPLPPAVADGIWCSFAAAYFCELAPVLAAWKRHLRPGGWIALTEIDDLFAHWPLPAHTAALLDAYAHDALQARRYDFRMGRRLPAELAAAGFTPCTTMALIDREFAFAGPADAAVLDGWRTRLLRMHLLHVFCGDAFASVRDELLRCLAAPGHRSDASVRFVLARA